LGSWCVKFLLDRGYTVHTTVRSAEKAAYLRVLPGSDRLKIFEKVDLLDAGAFDAAIMGCDAVLHTASPFYTKDGSEDKLVWPAVEGTRNVLTSCRRLGVKKVACTASTANIYINYGTLPADHVYTEEDWSPEGMLREKRNWYALSKVMAEKMAWQLSKEEGCPFQLVVLHPTLILGPMLPGQPHLNTSSSSLIGYVDGSVKEIENGCKTVVDVRDVAMAHIAAIERGTAWGRRVLLIAGSPHFKELAGFIRDTLPEEMKGHVPDVVSEKLGPTVLGAPPPNPVLYDAAPSHELLGIEYRSIEEQVKENVRTMLANGFRSASQYSTSKL